MSAAACSPTSKRAGQADAPVHSPAVLTRSAGCFLPAALRLFGMGHPAGPSGPLVALEFRRVATDSPSSYFVGNSIVGGETAMLASGWRSADPRTGGLLLPAPK